MIDRQVKIAPSVLAADFMNLERDLRQVEAGGADFHHVDVMDGHFVPNLSIGIPVVKAIQKIAQCPVDVHLMVANPDEVATSYADCGVQRVSFHVEASRHAHRLIQSLKDKGVQVGVSINPGTSLEALTPLLDMIDMVNIMSVNPGFGGQKFIEASLDRIKTIARWLKERQLDRVDIEVDGGIDAATGPKVRQAGANVLVAGTFVYGADDRHRAMAQLRQ